MVDNLIRLYNYDETSFSTNGLGTLADATECKVTEELNGSYELAMKYPIDGARYSDIELGMLIFARPNQYSDFEPFRIYSISRPLNGIVTINAQHISYDLSGYIMPRWDNSKVPFATGPRSAFERIDTEIKKVYPDFPFTFYTDSDEDHPAPDSDMWYELTCNVPKSVRSLLGDGDGNMLSKYTGDYLFEKFNVSFLTERGENKGVTIKYGKNMTELTVNEDNSTLYSAVYPYWTDQEKYVELPEKVIRVRDDIPDNTLLLDLSSDFAKCPADEDIREFVERYINDNNIGLPFSSIDVSFEQLSKSSEYSQYAMLEEVELGDYITVEYDLLLNGPQTVRCTKVVYDVLLDKAETIELGTSRTLVGSLAKQQSTLSNSTQYTDQYVQEAVKNITYDTALSTTSENAVQNKVITNKIRQTDTRVEECFTSVSNGKRLLAEAITEKGVETSSTDTFLQMHDNILEIPSGGSSGVVYNYMTNEIAFARHANYNSMTEDTVSVMKQTSVFSSLIPSKMHDDQTSVVNNGVWTADVVQYGGDNACWLSSPNKIKFAGRLFVMRGTCIANPNNCQLVVIYKNNTNGYPWQNYQGLWSLGRPAVGEFTYSIRFDPFDTVLNTPGYFHVYAENGIQLTAIGYFI
jgi:phage minor structural protein